MLEHFKQTLGNDHEAEFHEVEIVFVHEVEFV
jgi:hypothetical protein